MKKSHYPVAVLQKAGHVAVCGLEAGQVRVSLLLRQQGTFCFIPRIWVTQRQQSQGRSNNLSSETSQTIDSHLGNPNESKSSHVVCPHCKRNVMNMKLSKHVGYLGSGLHAGSPDLGWTELRHRDCLRLESERCDSSSLSLNPSSLQKPAHTHAHTQTEISAKKYRQKKSDLL